MREAVMQRGNVRLAPGSDSVVREEARALKWDCLEVYAEPLPGLELKPQPELYAARASEIAARRVARQLTRNHSERCGRQK